MKATIDRTACIACSLCADACPEVFAMADDGLAEVIADPTPSTLNAAKEGAESCPVSIITIEE